MMNLVFFSIVGFLGILFGYLLSGKLSLQRFALSVLFGASVFVIGWSVNWPALVALLLTLVGIIDCIVVIVAYRNTGKKFLPALFFGLAAVMAFVVMKRAAYRASTMWSSSFWTSLVVVWLPALSLTITVGLLLIIWLGKRSNGDGRSRYKVVEVMSILALVLAIILETVILPQWSALASFGKNQLTRAATFVGSSETLATETAAPIWSPTTEAPTTEAPTTEAPTTEAPTTEEPTTEEMLEEETTEEETYLSFEMYEKPEIPAWITLHNDPLIWDDDPSNDYNFGPSPVEDSEFVKLFSEKYPELTDSTLQFVAENEDKILENKKVADWAADMVRKDFQDRMVENPFTGAAWLAWFDSILGTRYMGEFYSQCNEQWDAAINQAAREFMDDQSLYYRTLTAFFRGYLENPLTRVELRKAEVMDDQMYLNPFTVDGIPDVIVLETKDHQGLFLVFVFTIKGQEFEVPFRINCGYQPTDVHEILHIDPLPEPPEPEKLPPIEVPTTEESTTEAPTTATPTTEAPTTQAPPPPTTATPTTEAPTTQAPPPPTTATPTTATPTKDPSKGLQTDVSSDLVAPNDNPGPGEYVPPVTVETTSSGEGLIEPEVISGKDEAVNGGSSTNQTSYDEYRVRMSELESINAAAQQQQTPTVAPTQPAPTQPAPTQAPATQAPTEALTQAPPTTHVDDNANVGNGGDPIDVATPTQPPAQIAPTGNDPAATPETISTQPVGAWGGPPD